jgi:hypothetical protein
MRPPNPPARRPSDARPSSNDANRRLALLLAFTFGVVFLAAILVLAVAIPAPTVTQFESFRIAIALAAGGLAAVIPGLLDVRFGGTGRFALRAGGALGVFVIVYFFSPARLVTNSVQQITQGSCSPAISSAGAVTLSCSSGGNRP